MARKNRTNTVSGHDGYYQKVDRAQAGLESDPRPDGNLFCRADARVTQPDVKGKITGPAALDIQLHRRYVVEQVAAGFPRCRPESICSISTQNGVYTKSGIDPANLNRVHFSKHSLTGSRCGGERTGPL